MSRVVTLGPTAGLRRTVGALLVAVLLTVSYGLATAPAASASTAPGGVAQDAGAALQQPVPPCVSLTTGSSGTLQYVRVRNGCETPVRLRVVWGSVAGACRTLAVGASITETRVGEPAPVTLRAC